MARHVFFSFHYQRDIWRVNTVRNSWLTKGNTTAGFWDDAKWESVKKQGDKEIKAWINRQMEGTSVTEVLIGAETYTREYVIYELQQSHLKEKGILGIYIHNIGDQYGKTDHEGLNPLDLINGDIKENVSLSDLNCKTYDWIKDEGYHNMGDWIEEAARNANR